MHHRILSDYKLFGQIINIYAYIHKEQRADVVLEVLKIDSIRDRIISF